MDSLEGSESPAEQFCRPLAGQGPTSRAGISGGSEGQRGQTVLPASTNCIPRLPKTLSFPQPPPRGGKSSSQLQEILGKVSRRMREHLAGVGRKQPPSRGVGRACRQQHLRLAHLATWDKSLTLPFVQAKGLFEGFVLKREEFILQRWILFYFNNSLPWFVSLSINLDFLPFFFFWPAGFWFFFFWLVCFVGCCFLFLREY